MKAILYLHGGGNSNHARYASLIERFATKGILGHAFDHHATTLVGRLDEAEQELAKLKSQHGLRDSDIYVWGSSMGGHIAARLTKTHPNLAGVILQSAAAYSQTAENIPFGPLFTDELMREKGWEDSDAFRDINLYQGKILVVYAENDTIIPQDIMRKYEARAKVKGEVRILNGVGHSLLRPHSQAEYEALEKLIQYAHQFISSKTY